MTFRQYSVLSARVVRYWSQKMNQPSSAEEDKRTVLLFGASNLTLGWSSVVGQLSQRFAAPIDLHCFLGMGRSWLKPSRYGFRVLPGILNCDFWTVPVTGRTASVLLTDAGNDIVYGFSAGQIAAALQETIERLRHRWCDAEIVITRPPMASLRSLSRFRFRIARTLLFPGSQLTLESAVGEAEQLDQEILQLGEEVGLTVVEPQSHWYGLDPIHIRRTCRDTAFQTMFSHWYSGNPAEPGQWSQTALPSLPKASFQLVFGRAVQTSQPVCSNSNWSVSGW